MMIIMSKDDEVKFEVLAPYRASSFKSQKVNFSREQGFWALANSSSSLDS
jgi:hypothetical protein